MGDSRAAQVVRSQLEPVPGATAARTRGRPWRLGVAVGGGYNSNARGTQALDPNDDVPEEGSAFVHLGLDAGYTLLQTADGDRLTAGYQLLADAYVEQEQDPDLLDQYAYLDYEHALGTRTSATARLSMNHTLVGEETLRVQLAARGSLLWRALPALLLETSYAFANDEYDTFVFDDPQLLQPVVLDRDADVHTLTVGAYLDVPRTRIRLRGGYFYSWNVAEENEFDNVATGFVAGASVPLWWKVTAEVAYAYTLERYEDFEPSESTPARRDDIHGFSARLTRPLTPKLSAYVEYSYNRDNSTDPGYDYEQHVTSAGLAWQF